MVRVEETLQTIAYDARYSGMPEHSQTRLPISGLKFVVAAKTNVAANQSPSLWESVPRGAAAVGQPVRLASICRGHLISLLLRRRFSEQLSGRKTHLSGFHLVTSSIGATDF